MLWMNEYYRATKDVDLLAFIPNRIENVRAIFGEICNVPVEPDGLIFNAGNIDVFVIQEDSEYDGIRVTFLATLEKTRIPLQFDLGFGDVVTPEAASIEYPSMLDFPSPRVRVYSPQSVTAEKIEAMVSLGAGNSRMKDFYDLYAMSRLFEFKGSELEAAIEATFKQRGTEIPGDIPVALTDEFAQDNEKAIQWRSFIKKFRLVHAPNNFSEVIVELRKFIMPIFISIRKGVSLSTKWDNITFTWK
jgi:hypothetical protein